MTERKLHEPKEIHCEIRCPRGHGEMRPVHRFYDADGFRRLYQCAECTANATLTMRGDPEQ